MFKAFFPDVVFDKFEDIRPEFLIEKGISAVLLDVDNTLVPYETKKPEANTIKWIKDMLKFNIKVCIFSNASESRVEEFAGELKTLGVRSVAKAGKPSKQEFNRFLTVYDLDPEEVAMIGDQIFTDIWGGNRSGVFTILVKPIDKNENIFIRFKRLLEKPVLRSYWKSYKLTPEAMIDTSLYAVIGTPIKHSISPILHNAIYKIKSENALYASIKVERDCLEKAIIGMKSQGIKGLNVTVPHKESVMEYLDHMSQEARDIGAVNTIINEGGVLTGYNTDSAGLIDAIEDMGFDPHGKKVLILGAGGTARSAGHAFLHSGATNIAYCNRTADKAHSLVDKYNKQYKVDVFTHLIFDEDNIDEFNKAFQEYDLIINTTSAGMAPQLDAMPISENVYFREGQYVYDVVYNPERTKFLEKAESEGCIIKNGLSLLIFQGIRAHNIWFSQSHNQDDSQLNAREIKEVKNEMYLVGGVLNGKVRASR